MTGRSSRRRRTRCGAPTACGVCHDGRTGGAGSSQRSSTGTRRAWDGTCARLGAGLRRFSRSPRRLAAHLWRHARRRQRTRAAPTDGSTAASTCPTTFSGRSGIAAFGPATALLYEPATNGVAERWNRTLKEQAIHGRIFQNLKEVRAAVTAFVERYKHDLAAREARCTTRRSKPDRLARPAGYRLEHSGFAALEPIAQGLRPSLQALTPAFRLRHVRLPSWPPTIRPCRSLLFLG